MIDFHLRAGIRALSALTLTAGVLFAAGCVQPLPNQPDARLTVTATQPSGTYQPGDDIAFHVTVTNAGSKDVTLLAIQTTLDAKVRERSVSCSGLGPSAAFLGTAECGGFIYMQRLAAGASVTLDVVATVRTTSQGTITNTIAASVNSGPAPVTASSSATIVDTRGGTYQAFASNGQTYSLAADFASATATFSGTGASVALPISAQVDSETYFLPGGTGFRGHHDLLAGTVALGSGVTPFIAGRSFVTTLAALDGRTFNTLAIDSPTNGAATSRFLTTSFSGATMQVCADAVPHAIATCPAASLLQYGLSVTGSVFTGIDAAHNDTVTFQVAQSDSALVLLRAEATPTGRVFQVGLSTNAGIAAMRLEGGDTLGRWGVLALAPPNLRESFPQSDGSNLNVDGSLSGIAGAPAGLASSFLVNTASPVYLAEDSGLAIVLGQPGGPLDGLLQVFAY
jgi:hypothetical protein